MRGWLYDTLVGYPDLQGLIGGVEGIKTRTIPRESQSTINLPRPFLVYGLGNSTNEDLSEDLEHQAERQFSQIWVHDESGDFSLIDDIVREVKRALRNKGSAAHGIITTRYLETSQEFANETYNTIFRYVRFQHIITEGVPA